MKIILSNNLELNPILITGASRHVQGMQRDVLSFIFPASVGMDALDEAFSPEACESINIIEEDGTENIHKNYTIRTELKKTAMEVTPATPDAEAVIEQRITVSMAQRSYAENQMASLTETVDALVLDSLMG